VSEVLKQLLAGKGQQVERARSANAWIHVGAQIAWMFLSLFAEISAPAFGANGWRNGKNVFSFCQDFFLNLSPGK
jgi:hypothetical protein